MTWFERLVLLVSFMQFVGIALTAAVAFNIYKRQKKDSEDTAKREARVRLTRAYFQFNAEILRSEGNVNAMRDLFYPQYSSHETQLIEFMFMILNTIYLEWTLYKEHTHSEEEFNRTLESLMIPFSKNVKNHKSNRFLIDDFEKIFIDFPDEFKRAVLLCIKDAPDES